MRSVRASSGAVSTSRRRAAARCAARSSPLHVQAEEPLQLRPWPGSPLQIGDGGLGQLRVPAPGSQEHSSRPQGAVSTGFCDKVAYLALGEVRNLLSGVGRETKRAPQPARR